MRAYSPHINGHAGTLTPSVDWEERTRTHYEGDIDVGGACYTLPA